MSDRYLERNGEEAYIVFELRAVLCSASLALCACLKWISQRMTIELYIM